MDMTTTQNPSPTATFTVRETSAHTDYFLVALRIDGRVAGIRYEYGYKVEAAKAMLLAEATA